MRSNWLCDAQTQLILGAMMPENRLALKLSDATGLRIDDVLSIKTDTIRTNRRPYITDSKTGKKHRVYIPSELHAAMLKQAGNIYVWPSRCDSRKHRTRQAVYKDMKAAVSVFRRNKSIEPNAAISPHSMRKRAAVRAFHDGGLAAAASMLNHSRNDAAVTLLYALADTDKPKPRKRRKTQKTGL